MTRFMGFALTLAMLTGVVSIAAAQDKAAGTMSPPKVLTIFREFLKPGKTGMVHEKSESAFIQALTHAKWPTHYLTVNSLSGKPRALFLTGYDSFDAWEKDAKATEKNEALSSALDRAAVADGELLDSADAAAMAYSEEYSYHSAVDIPHMRYFEISVYRVRPGHRKEWDEAVKLVTAGYEKGIPDSHWATYEVVYGAPEGTFVIFVPLKAAADIDHYFAEGKAFEDAMGENGMKRLAELTASAIESVETNLFVFSPNMSYVSDDWVKADPDFWKPKKSMAMPKKPSEKPAEKPAGQ